MPDIAKMIAHRRALRAYKAIKGLIRYHRSLGHTVETCLVNDALLEYRCVTCSHGAAAAALGVSL